MQDEIDLLLPNGYAIRQCKAKLLTRYLGSPNALVFDLYAEEQQRRPNLCLRFAPMDGFVTTLVGSSISVEQWLHLGETIPVAIVPAARLEPGQALEGTLLELYRHVHGILREDLACEAYPRCFKLLALKRPFLYPMIDSGVAELFLDRWKGGYTWPAERRVGPRAAALGQAPVLFGEFAWALGELHPQLETLAGWLCRWLDERCDLQLALSPVRILDALIDFDARQEVGRAGPWHQLGWRGLRDGRAVSVVLERRAELPPLEQALLGGAYMHPKKVCAIRLIVDQLLGPRQ